MSNMTANMPKARINVGVKELNMVRCLHGDF